jgi:hypothetical protein
VAGQPSGNSETWYEAPPHEIGEDALFALTWGVTKGPQPAPSGRPRWLVGDHDSLTVSLKLEERLKTEGLPADAPDSVRAELNGYLDDWHTALPLTEAERGVALDVFRAWVPDNWGWRRLPSDIRKVKTEAISAGIRSEVDGGDMMRRWWSWRREMDEFAGQDSLTQARVALQGLASRLIPPDTLPFMREEIEKVGDPSDGTW